MRTGTMTGNIAEKNSQGFEPDLNFVNGVPWPWIPDEISRTENPEFFQTHWDEELQKINIPLKQEYYHRAMNYLDSEQASPMFKWQADFMMNRNCKTIVDVGCRHAPILDHFYNADYMDSNFRYYGFDTSSESIELGQQLWSQFDNVLIEQKSWDDDLYSIDTVDCMLFSGVLLYEPEAHMQLFARLCKQYNTKYAVIQEPLPADKQVHWLSSVHLNTIQDQLHLYKQEYTMVENEILEMSIFSGNRELLGLELSNT